MVILWKLWYQRVAGPMEGGTPTCLPCVNENEKNGKPTEKHFGLFFPNKEPMYPIDFKDMFAIFNEILVYSEIRDTLLKQLTVINIGSLVNLVKTKRKTLCDSLIQKCRCHIWRINWSIWFAECTFFDRIIPEFLRIWNRSCGYYDIYTNFGSLLICVSLFKSLKLIGRDFHWKTDRVSPKNILKPKHFYLQQKPKT